MEEATRSVLFTNDAVVFGLLMLVLGLVFYTSNLKGKFFKRLYTVFPPLLMCYFLPGLLNSFNIIDGENSGIADVGSKYLLPACLVLFTINLDLKELWKLRKRAGLIFLAGSVGIIIGGPIALWIVSKIAPGVVAGTGADAVWRGFGSLAGSWIGGSANELALKEILQPSPKLFSAIVTVDVFIGYGWMALLLFLVNKKDKFNKWLKADTSDVEHMIHKMDAEGKKNNRIPEAKDLIMILSVAFAAAGVGALLSGPIANFFKTNYPSTERFSLTSTFFWMILIVTIIGIVLSFTRAKKLEYTGASKMGTALLYVLILTIGMQMNILAILGNPGLFLVGIIWIFIHACFIMLVARLTHAPFFYFVVGSMANVGGVASASVTAAAFHNSLVPVGVVLGVFGYAIGTYGGWLCAMLLRLVMGG